MPAVDLNEAIVAAVDHTVHKRRTAIGHCSSNKSVAQHVRQGDLIGGLYIGFYALFCFFGLPGMLRAHGATATSSDQHTRTLLAALTLTTFYSGCRRN
jgi:hypothetical protein